jgi:HlyD family secretion protein
VAFGHRTEDSRLEIRGGIPDGAAVVTEVSASLQEGRAARAIEEKER